MNNENLEFALQSIEIGEGVLSLFCPHIEYCGKEDVDTNCFYKKFLHCEKARRLEKKYLLKQIDKFYLKYKDLILKGEYYLVKR